MNRKLNDLLALRFTRNPSEVDGEFLRLLAGGLMVAISLMCLYAGLAASIGTTLNLAAAILMPVLLILALAAFFIDMELMWGPWLGAGVAAVCAAALFFVRAWPL